MNVETIEVLFSNIIAIISLPVHTSDQLQPLDVSGFGHLKHYENHEINEESWEYVKSVSDSHMWLV